MTKVTTGKQLEQALMKAVYQAMEDTGEDVARKIKLAINEEVYNSYEPVTYERSYNLINSIEIKKRQTNNRNRVTFSVGHNTSKLNYNSVNEKRGKTVSPNIPEIIQSGKAGGMYEKGYWKNKKWYKSGVHTFAVKRPYLEKVRKDLKKGEYRKLMIKSLRNQGLEVR